MYQRQCVRTVTAGLGLFGDNKCDSDNDDHLLCSYTSLTRLSLPKEFVVTPYHHHHRPHYSIVAAAVTNDVSGGWTDGITGRWLFSQTRSTLVTTTIMTTITTVILIAGKTRIRKIRYHSRGGCNDSDDDEMSAVTIPPDKSDCQELKVFHSIIRTCPMDQPSICCTCRSKWRWDCRCSVALSRTNSLALVRTSRVNDATATTTTTTNSSLLFHQWCRNSVVPRL